MMKCYIIRLPSNKFSLELSQSSINQAKKFNIYLEPFDGVTGYKAKAIFQDDSIQKYPKFLKHDTAGVMGCAASHYLLWKRCSEQEEPFLILEHDGYFIDYLPHNIENDFEEIIKLDIGNPYSSDYEKTFNSNDDQIKVVDFKRPIPFKDFAAPYGNYFNGAYAYIIKPSAAQKIIKAMKKNGWVPSDKQIGANLFKLQMTSKSIVRLHPIYNHKNITRLSLTRNLKWLDN